MSRRYVQIAALVVFIVTAYVGQAGAEIWGVKTSGPFSGPPSTLYRFEPDGSPFEVIGVVTLEDLEVDIDGLAMDRWGNLFGFVAGNASGLLVNIDTETAVATPIGYLSGREIRGATITRGGDLIGIDTFSRSLITVDPATAQQIAPPVPLTLNGMPFPAGSATDLAIRDDGLAVICKENIELYEVDLATGEVTLLHADQVPGSDGARLFGAGLAFPVDLEDERLVVFDVNGTDDLFAYDLEAPFTRSSLFANIVPEYDAGRGDLASWAFDPLSGAGDPVTVPASPRLHQNFPNPFNPTTVIAFTLPVDSPVSLVVHSLDGRRVTTLVDGVRPAGPNEATWHGADETGRAVASGTYLARLRVGETVQTRLMTLLR